MRVGEKADPAERASGLYTEGMDMGRREFESNVAPATKPELADPIHHMEEKRTPEICNIAAGRGNIVDGAPPRHPEVDPAEYIWSMIKAGYGTRYGAVGVMEYVRGFCDEISAVALSNISGRCDKVASRMAGG